MSVGDVTSSAKGSGARYNDGKPDLSLIPFGILEGMLSPSAAPGEDSSAGLLALMALKDFQVSGNRRHLWTALDHLDYDGEIVRHIAEVFKYGKAKYAAWNWAKGMAWSVPMACAARHIFYGMCAGEELDAESGLPHRGHVGCNIVMLLHFLDSYPQGNDLPAPVLFTPF